MLRKGDGQVRKDDSCLNKIPHNNALVGEGIYCSPHFITCLKDYTDLS